MNNQTSTTDYISEARKILAFRKTGVVELRLIRRPPGETTVAIGGEYQVNGDSGVSYKIRPEVLAGFPDTVSWVLFYSGKRVVCQDAWQAILTANEHEGLRTSGLSQAPQSNTPVRAAKSGLTTRSELSPSKRNSS